MAREPHTLIQQASASTGDLKQQRCSDARPLHLLHMKCYWCFSLLIEI